MRRLLAFVAVLVSLAGCGTATFSLGGPLAIRAGAGDLQLENRTSAPVYTFVIERETAAVANWAPCTNPATCEAIAPGQQRRIAYDDIPGYEPGDDEAIVYWWHLIPAPGGGFATDSMRSEVVPLD
jgi:hypothetical protein